MSNKAQQNAQKIKQEEEAKKRQREAEYSKKQAIAKGAVEGDGTTTLQEGGEGTSPEDGPLTEDGVLGEGGLVEGGDTDGTLELSNDKPVSKLNPLSALIEKDNPIAVVGGGIEVGKAFATAIAMAKTKGDVIHISNVADNMEKLLKVPKVGATKEVYAKSAQRLLSTIRSLSLLSDSVFIAAFPAVLDVMEEGMNDTNLLITHPTAAFKLFTNSNHVRGLDKSHAQFITAVQALAPKETRRKLVKEIDLNFNFAVLPDVKRTQIKAIFK